MAFRSWCKQTLSVFLSRHPEASAGLEELGSLLATDVELRNRHTLPGHLTASALIFNASRQSLLLIHNRNLDRWLQPGGHMEAGESPLETARREVLEETGLEGLTLLPALESDPIFPWDIDSHAIPANPRKGEPAHTHHDFRYAMVLPADRSTSIQPQLSEIFAAKWVPLSGPESGAIEPGLLRTVSRVLRTG